MSTKICFKCNTRKPLEQFYKHKQMADGHLNKCKACAKQDVKKRYNNPEARERIREYERERFQTPERKAKAIRYQQEHRKRNPGRARARQAIRFAIRNGLLIRKPCEVCSDTRSEAHHKNYTKPYDVRWLCFRHHREEHGHIVGSTLTR